MHSAATFVQKCIIFVWITHHVSCLHESCCCNSFWLHSWLAASCESCIACNLSYCRYACKSNLTSFVRLADESGSGEEEEEEEEEPDSPLESLYPGQGQSSESRAGSRSPMTNRPSWGGHTSLQPAFSFRSSHSPASSGMLTFSQSERENKTFT